MSYLKKKVCDNVMLGAWKNCKIVKLRDMNVLPEGQYYWHCGSATGTVAGEMITNKLTYEAFIERKI
jgi:hypothetical protein